MFKLRKRKQRQPTRTPRKLFHGVSVTTGSGFSCQAADDLKNVRYLADEAPMLPLAGCSSPSECRCRYEHFDDRRTDARRESDVGLPMKDHPNDARSGFGRRVTDG